MVFGLVFFPASFTSMVFIWTTNGKQKWELTCSIQWIVGPFRAGGSLSHRPVLSQIYKCPKLDVFSKPLINSGHHLCPCVFLQWSSILMPGSLIQSKTWQTGGWLSWLCRCYLLQTIINRSWPWFLGYVTVNALSVRFSSWIQCPSHNYNNDYQHVFKIRW